MSTTALPSDRDTAELASSCPNPAPAADAWRGFQRGSWESKIDVRDFIQLNYRVYEGNQSFLSPPTRRTEQLWDKLKGLLDAEQQAGGVLDADTKTVGQIASHLPGYIDKELEQIVGVQTDAPLKRALMPYGGLRVAQNALEAHGRTMDADTAAVFTQHRKTHNDGVFDAYTPAIRRARSAGIVTGLPDGYGRGRIIGDYRRVALYGVDRLIEDKRAQHAETDDQPFSEEWARQREEIQDQLRAWENSSGWRCPTGSTSPDRP